MNLQTWLLLTALRPVLDAAHLRNATRTANRARISTERPVAPTLAAYLARRFSK